MFAKAFLSLAGAVYVWTRCLLFRVLRFDFRFGLWGFKILVWDSIQDLRFGLNIWISVKKIWDFRVRFDLIFAHHWSVLKNLSHSPVVWPDTKSSVLWKYILTRMHIKSQFWDLCSFYLGRGRRSRFDCRSAVRRKFTILTDNVYTLNNNRYIVHTVIVFLQFRHRLCRH